MHEQVAKLLACPVCHEPLAFEGERTDHRLTNGLLKCSNNHIFQVKEEIGLLKDAKLSANEFEWKVNVANEKVYDETQKQYDSYLRQDQKTAIKGMKQRLIDLVVASCKKSDNVALDVATGMGSFLLPLAEQGSENMRFLGTDIDEKPLRGTLDRAKKTGAWKRISLIVTDAKRLAIRDNCLSTISSFFGFDNVPETFFSFRECTRILRVGGQVFFSSLWFNERSESMRLAEKYKVCQIASENRLRKVLGKANLSLEYVEEMYSGVWPHNPMDLLPVEGDEYRHVVVHVKK